MRLSIRWKFILSIGLTLLVTYVALLVWDYRWQRETADLHMQDLVTSQGRALASSLNDRMSSAERQADSFAAILQAARPTSPEALRQTLGSARPNGNLVVIWQMRPDDEFRADVAFRITERGGPNFSRRGGGGGGPPATRPLGREGRGREGRGLDGRGRRGPGGSPASIVEIEPEPRRMVSGLIQRQPHSEWTPPRPAEEVTSWLACLYVVPIQIDDRIHGYVAAIAPVEELAQYRPPPTGRGASTRPATVPVSSSTGESVAILDDQGRRIWPTAPPGGRGAPPSEPQAVLGSEEVFDQFHAALAGESKVVSVANQSALVPGSTNGESYWVALEPVTASNWVIAVAMPESRFISRIVDRLWQRGLFLIAGLLLLMAIVMLVSIRLTQPIERMAGAVQQLAAGNLDAQVTGVNSRDELGQLARAFNTMTGQLKQHVADLTEQTAARQSVEAELRIARQIQSDLLPRKFPPFPDRNEFELHAVNVAAKRVAGDFFDFFFAPNGLLTITIADVAGKGMPAALLMAVTRTIIRNLAMEGHSPAQIIERANALLIQDITNSMFVTLFLLQYDTRTGRIVYVNAGHPRPYRFGVDGSPKQFGEVTGPILGVASIEGDWAFEEREERLGVGETLLLYTDGVTEARAPDDSMLRDAGLEQLIVKYGRETVKTICDKFVEEVDRFQKGHQSDDITLLALRRVR